MPKNGRRRSSISYLSPNTDNDRPTSLLSPLPPTGFSGGTSSSSGTLGSPGIELEIEGSRVTAGGNSAAPSEQFKGRAPVTLAEKYVP